MFNLKYMLSVGLLLCSVACSKKTKKSKMKRGNVVHHNQQGRDSVALRCVDNGPLAVTHFGFDKYHITDSGERIVAQNVVPCLVKELIEKPENRGKHILITGYCDPRGSVEYNIALGYRRATSVKDFLLSTIAKDGVKGINVCAPRSRGKADLVDHGKSEEAYAKNRRAVIEIVDECPE